MDKVDLSQLSAPTPESEIKHREQAGKTLSYIDARYCMDTLDTICGPGNWCDNYKEVKGLMMCGVSIFVNGIWVTKWDTGSEANFEKEKSIVSDSFKRACVKWGIGRFLYSLKIISLPTKSSNGREYPYFDKQDKILYGGDELSKVCNYIMKSKTK